MQRPYLKRDISLQGISLLPGTEFSQKIYGLGTDVGICRGNWLGISPGNQSLKI